MARNLSEEDVHQAIGQVMHPEINRMLVELGTVKDRVLKYLVNSLRQAATKLGNKTGCESPNQGNGDESGRAFGFLGYGARGLERSRINNNKLRRSINGL